MAGLTYFAYTVGATMELYLRCYLLARRATLMPVLGLGWSAAIDYHDC